jgi:hypothetical protein
MLVTHKHIYEAEQDLLGIVFGWIGFTIYFKKKRYQLHFEFRR